MEFILTAIGSSGDVFPKVGIGLRLRERGHEEVLVASAQSLRWRSDWACASSA